MRKRVLRTFTLLSHTLILLAGVSQARSEDVHCLETDTPRECVRRLQSERDAAVMTAVAAVNTGDSSGATAARTALKDFLGVAAAHVDGALLEDRGESLALRYNLPVRFGGARHRLQLQTVFATPQISNATAAAVGPSAPALVSTLSNADDIRTTVSYKPVTRRMGHEETKPHRELLEALFLPLLAKELPALLEGDRYDVPLDQIVTDQSSRAATVAAFETAVRGALAGQLTTDLANVLSGQPAFYVTGTIHHREPAIGPHVWQAMATYEFGAHNLNGFYRREGTCLREGNCLEAFQQYAKGTPAARSRGRLALSLAYNKVLSSAPDIPNPYVTPQAAGFAYTAAYGLPFASFLPGKEGRLDFTLTYDGAKVRRNVVGGSSTAVTISGAIPPIQSLEPRRDRIVAAGTYTQRLSERLSAPVSLIWSDRSETLPGACFLVDSEFFECAAPVVVKSRPLAVHVGLTYRIPPRTPVRPAPSCCCCDQ